MKIGQVAKACGVSTDTIRFYERSGLLPRSSRNFNGYRIFGVESVARVKFVRSAQTLGFTLSEIAVILPLVDQATFTREDLEKELQVKVKLLNGHIQQMQKLKANLKQTLQALSCEGSTPLDLRSVTLT